MIYKTKALIVFLLILSSCSKVSSITPTDTPFAVTDSLGRQPSTWNEMIMLQLPTNLEANTLKFYSIVNLEIINLSSAKIRLPKGYNLKIFNLSAGEKEIQNTVKYSGTDLVLEPSQQKIGSSTLIGFSPDIQSNSEQKIRVLVIGETISNDPQKSVVVGAYVDIVLHP